MTPGPVRSGTTRLSLVVVSRSVSSSDVRLRPLSVTRSLPCSPVNSITIHDPSGILSFTDPPFSRFDQPIIPSKKVPLLLSGSDIYSPSGHKVCLPCNSRFCDLPLFDPYKLLVFFSETPTPYHWFPFLFRITGSPSVLSFAHLKLSTSTPQI